MQNGNGNSTMTHFHFARAKWKCEMYFPFLYFHFVIRKVAREVVRKVSQKLSRGVSPFGAVDCDIEWKYKHFRSPGGPGGGHFPGHFPDHFPVHLKCILHFHFLQNRFGKLEIFHFLHFQFNFACKMILGKWDHFHSAISILHNDFV